jgi:hypothetical protein
MASVLIDSKVRKSMPPKAGKAASISQTITRSINKELIHCPYQVAISEQRASAADGSLRLP